MVKLGREREKEREKEKVEEATEENENLPFSSAILNYRKSMLLCPESDKK